LTSILLAGEISQAAMTKNNHQSPQLELLTARPIQISLDPRARAEALHALAELLLSAIDGWRREKEDRDEAR
jgi:hypothetical protein